MGSARWSTAPLVDERGGIQAVVEQVDVIADIEQRRVVLDWMVLLPDDEVPVAHVPNLVEGDVRDEQTDLHPNRRVPGKRQAPVGHERHGDGGRARGRPSVAHNPESAAERFAFLDV